MQYGGSSPKKIRWLKFELADKLFELLKINKLDDAIQLAEKELKAIPETDFHQILGMDMLHLTKELKVFIQDFDKSTSAELKMKRGMRNQFLASKRRCNPLPITVK